jgi:hypothetical protein
VADFAAMATSALQLQLWEKEEVGCIQQIKAGYNFIDFIRKK